MNLQTLQTFLKLLGILDLLAIQENFKNHGNYFEASNIPGLVKHLLAFQETFKIIENILKLPRHFRTCQTSRTLFWTFWQYRRLLKIIETYFEPFKTFLDLTSIRNIILDLLTIQNNFKNHRKIF